MPRAVVIPEPEPARTRSTAAARGAWGMTLLATVASTYALDAFAVAVGAGVAASGVLDGLGGAALLCVLGVSYAIWGLALRANLAANWSLLAATGASTNVLSKAAHDLARSRGLGARGRRRAASAGYVLTELAKELPYYLSVFGAVLATDAVSAADAVIFLAGTNVGAALYEYGVACATRAFLARRGAARQASDGASGSAHRLRVRR